MIAKPTIKWAACRECSWSGPLDHIKWEDEPRRAFCPRCFLFYTQDNKRSALWYYLVHVVCQKHHDASQPCPIVGNQVLHPDGYKFVWHDAGRSSSKRPRQKNDCTVRSVALAFNLPYDKAFDVMKVSGRVNSQGFWMREWLAKIPKYATKLNIPEPVDLKDFMRCNPPGTYICLTVNHAFCVKDGVVFDSYLFPYQILTQIWKIQL